VPDPVSGSVTVPVLIVTGGPLDGTLFEVDDSPRDRLIGSSSDCDLQILLGNVEPIHAKVNRGPRGLLLADGGSATGTYVNGEKIEGDCLLQDGDRICLGPPGSKSSAKLLVKLPTGGAALPLDATHSLGHVAAPRLSAPDKPFSLAEPQAGLVAAPPLVLMPPQPPTVAPPPPFSPPTVSPPPPPPPAAAPRPAPPPPPPAPPKPAPPPLAPTTKARPEYTDTPSIAPPPDTGEAAEPPTPAARPVAKPAKKSPLRAGPRLSVPPAALYGLLAVVVLGGGAAAVRLLWKTPPVLTRVIPERTEPGQTVTLSGEKFASQAADDLVRFGDQTGQVTSATETQLAVTVPAGLAEAGPVEVPITVQTRGGQSKAVTLKVYRPPKVTSVEPEVAMPGDELIIKGQSLKGKPLSVAVGGMIAEVKEAQAEQLRVIVPSLPSSEGHKASVNVQVGPDSAKPGQVILGRLPLVLGVSPGSGSAGSRVVVQGRGFDPSPEGNLVTFSGQPALVLGASPNELTVAAPTAPTADTQSETEVVVKAKGKASTSSARFVLMRLSSGTFIPRFFAAPVAEHPGDDVAFVSTELGPLLLLGGKGIAPSTGERAVRVADALNGLVERAASQAPAFELREKPELAVAVAGVLTPLATVTATDAAAYSRGWGETGGKGASRASTRSVATHWTALLQDYFGLFLLKQRPLKVLELTPRAKVLSDIYADALRQVGPGNGVPIRIVLPLGSGLGKSLREMALIIPDQPARTAVAVEGRWEGTMEEGGGGGRMVQVRLRFEGTKLTGTLTTQAGSIEMRAPLRDITYDKGTLRFVVDLSGSPRLFSGPVEADSIEGTIQRAAGDKAQMGRFTLKYAE